jgi:hypothetical protein
MCRYRGLHCIDSERKIRYLQLQMHGGDEGLILREFILRKLAQLRCQFYPTWFPGVNFHCRNPISAILVAT